MSPGRKEERRTDLSSPSPKTRVPPREMYLKKDPPPESPAQDSNRGKRKKKGKKKGKGGDQGPSREEVKGPKPPSSHKVPPSDGTVRPPMGRGDPPPAAPSEGWTEPRRGKRKKRRGKQETSLAQPPPPPTPQRGKARGGDGATTSGRKRKDGEGPVRPPPRSLPQKGGTRGNGRTADRTGRPPPARQRLPRTAAVTITCGEGGPSYAEAVTKARKEVCLETLKITENGLRRAATGALIFEIPGEGKEEKADDLARRLREVFANEDVRISRPTRRGELRVSNMDDSITAAEVLKRIAQEGGIHPDEIRMGPMRQLRNGLFSVWAQCPLAAALRVSKTGRLRIGWSSAGVELLKRRPLRCYKCLAVGHVRQRCPSKVDRSNCCYNCGREGHNAYKCKYKPHCPVCEARDRGADHRAGAVGCLPVFAGPLRVRTAVAAVRRTANEEVPMDTANGEVGPNKHQQEP